MHRCRLLALSGLLALFADSHQSAAEDARFFRISGPAATTITEFRPDGTLVWTNALAGTNYIVQTASTLAGGTNWVDYVQLPTTNYANTNWIIDFQPPSGMALIPAGSFTMGNSMGLSEGDPNELPLHTVYVSAFYMDKYDVTYAQWQTVYNWAIAHGYSFNNAGSGKAANHPVQTVNWYDCVKWCNARSEMEGRTPAYYTNSAQTTVYRSGQVSVDRGSVKWNAGYRLPTEAEWEKAARGGASGQRFPWGNTISHSQANYFVNLGAYSYDVNTTSGYHPAFNDGVWPYTSPVNYFAPNGYGLYDMVGNVWQWCWDGYGLYSSASQSDPRGPPVTAFRVIRGGGWSAFANGCRAAYRIYYDRPTISAINMGFRSVLTPDQ